MNSDYIVKLSNYLTCYNDKLENVISINSYVSSINYEFYKGTSKSALNTLLSFGGNCVDQTNVFVSLSRIAGYGSRYLSLENNNGGGHEIGQILVDGIWITVDNSAATSNNGVYTKMSECRYIGNKNYLPQNNYHITACVIVIYSNSEGISFSLDKNRDSSLLNKNCLMEQIIPDLINLKI